MNADAQRPGEPIPRTLALARMLGAMSSSQPGLAIFGPRASPARFRAVLGAPYRLLWELRGSRSYERVPHGIVGPGQDELEGDAPLQVDQHRSAAVHGQPCAPGCVRDSDHEQGHDRSRVEPTGRTGTGDVVVGDERRRLGRLQDDEGRAAGRRAAEAQEAACRGSSRKPRAPGNPGSPWGNVISALGRPDATAAGLRREAGDWARAALIAGSRRARAAPSGWW
jgi:hypothetical protein